MERDDASYPITTQPTHPTDLLEPLPAAHAPDAASGSSAGALHIDTRAATGIAGRGTLLRAAP